MSPCLETVKQPLPQRGAAIRDIRAEATPAWRQRGTKRCNQHSNGHWRPAANSCVIFARKRDARRTGDVEAGEHCRHTGVYRVSIVRRRGSNRPDETYWGRNACQLLESSETQSLPRERRIIDDKHLRLLWPRSIITRNLVASPVRDSHLIPDDVPVAYIVRIRTVTTCLHVAHRVTTNNGIRLGLIHHLLRSALSFRSAMSSSGRGQHPTTISHGHFTLSTGGNSGETRITSLHRKCRQRSKRG